MQRTSLPVSIVAVAFAFVATPLAAQSTASSGAAPDPCTLFTKADLQQATGNADVMRVRNMADTMGAGKVCTIDGGGAAAKRIDIEVIVYPAAPNIRVTVPKGAEAVGENGYFQQTPGNAAAYAQKGAFALRIGLQSGDTPQNMRTVALALLKAGIAKFR